MASLWPTRTLARLVGWVPRWHRGWQAALVHIEGVEVGVYEGLVLESWHFQPNRKSIKHLTPS